MNEMLVEEILMDGVYDWVSLANIYSEALHLSPEQDREALIKLSKNAVRQLVNDGDMLAGIITYDGFEVFPDMLNEFMEKMDLSFAGNEDQFDFWLSATSTGKLKGRELLKRRLQCEY